MLKVDVENEMTKNNHISSYCVKKKSYFLSQKKNSNQTHFNDLKIAKY